MKTTSDIREFCNKRAAALDMSKKGSWAKHSAYREIASWSTQVSEERLVELIRESYVSYQELLIGAHKTRRTNWQSYIATYEQIARYAGIVL